MSARSRCARGRLLDPGTLACLAALALAARRDGGTAPEAAADEASVPSVVAEAATPQAFDPAADLLVASSEALARGELGAALDAARAALEHVPDEPAARLTLARALVALGHDERAVEALAPALEHAPGSPWLLLERARALRGLERATEAEADLRAALASYPASGPAALELGELLLDGGRVEEARGLADELLARAPARDEVVGLAADCRVALGGAEEARVLLQERLDAAPEATALRLRLADLHAAAGRTAEAWATCEPLLAEEDRPDVLVRVARVALTDGRPLEALAALGSALAKDPTYAAALAELGELLEHEPDMRGRLARRRVEARPNDAASWHEALEVELDAGALDAFFAALAEVPAAARAHPRVRLLEGEALRRADRLDEARAVLGPLCEGAHAARAWYEIGLLEYAAGRPAVAEAAFERGAAGAWTADAHFNRGVCLERLGRFAGAARSYEAAVGSRAEFPEAWYQLGALRRLRLGDAEGARAAWREYLRLGGDDPEVRRWLERDGE